MSKPNAVVEKEMASEPEDALFWIGQFNMRVPWVARACGVRSSPNRGATLNRRPARHISSANARASLRQRPERTVCPRSPLSRWVFRRCPSVRTHNQ